MELPEPLKEGEELSSSLAYTAAKVYRNRHIFRRREGDVACVSVRPVSREVGVSRSDFWAPL